MMTPRRALIAAVLGVIVASCATAPDTAVETKPPAKIAGKWKGSFTGPEGVNPVKVELEQKDTAVSGTIHIRHVIGNPTSGWIKGVVKGNKITLDAQYAQLRLRLDQDGKIRGDGRSSVYFTVFLERDE